MYVKARDGNVTIKGHNVYTGHAYGMGLADTSHHGLPSKPGRTRDGHGTAPGCSRVNGRALVRRNGRRQRNLFAFVMAFQ